MRFARELKKDNSPFLPTGTLANHLALKCLASGKSRVLVQAESHIYRDSLDCVQTLSHLNLVPLAPSRATVTVQEIEAACRDAVQGPFPTPIGAIHWRAPYAAAKARSSNTQSCSALPHSLGSKAYSYIWTGLGSTPHQHTPR